MSRRNTRKTVTVSQTNVTNEELLDDKPSTKTQAVETHTQEPEVRVERKTRRNIKRVVEQPKVEEKKDELPPQQPALTRRPLSAWNETVKKYGGIKKKDSEEYKQMMEYYNKLKLESQSKK